ncbi:Cytoplasmic GTPase/eEF2-like protein (ribosomal biogenesis) [Malassezia yamatoensis]|uniref:Elongation factor 2 n=1 Tax=Malassezia yamatoensis TaxID=253288 RepID=A0AAJ5YSG2_9BASI|nr:Cytoplasmic GTPase/eEF2-like protein (ribosomal biogenesis) [Malassezia yamatoensis]
MPPSKAFGAQNLRNCTLIGHVDHGKSSYADSLLAANGIISSKSAGQVRYLDSREDEQERGITMEASAVSLSFKLRSLGADGNISEVKDYMLNLVDTPGHVDFSSEVSSASRLCDGALVIVDIIEGVCSQTINVLRQAWLDGLRTILVVNKMDRLITELKLSPTEAHYRLLQLVEQANAVIGGFFTAERMEHEQRLYDEQEKAREMNQTDTQQPIVLEDKDDEDLYFDPSKGNVIFASAMDHWAFRLEKFSHIYGQKLGIKEQTIRRFLWGNYYLDPKTKRVLTQKQMEKEKRALKPMFVQFVLDNIWSIYENTVEQRDMEKVEKIIAALNLTIHPRDLKAKEATTLLQAIMSQWLPLSSCTFAAIVHNLPAPNAAQQLRLPRMIRPGIGYFASEQELAPHNEFEKQLFTAEPGNDAGVVVYISKMFAVSTEDLPENKRVQLTADEMRQRGREMRQRAQDLGSALAATGAALPTHDSQDNDSKNTSDSMKSAVAPAETEQKLEREVVLGFARIYSGCINVGDEMFAILPKYKPEEPATHPSNTPYIKSIKVEALYMMMGRDLVAVQSVPAGNLFAVRGLDGVVLRNGTLIRIPQQDAPPSQVINLAGVRRNATPIVRVALEPKNPADMPKLVEGLRLLNQADPCVEVMVQDNGEHVIMTAGELHLERCMKDLRERFARCKIQQSPPLVPYRETAVKGASMPPPKMSGAPRGTVSGTALNGAFHYTIRAVPLPAEITDFLVINQTTIRKLLRKGRQESEGDDDQDPDDNHSSFPSDMRSNTEKESDGNDQQAKQVSVRYFWDELQKVCDRCGPRWASILDQICAFGPRNIGPNLLIDQNVLNRSLRHRHDDLTQQMATTSLESGALSREIVDAVENGFRLAAAKGPMCAEPMQGIAFFVERIEMEAKENVKSSQVISSVISHVREACKAGLLDWSPRLMLAMYSCEIQAAPEVQGKVHAVLSRRRGRIVSEEMKEGTLFFTIGALLPVAESFGFAEEIRKRTSGAASPQLLFAGFQLFDLDPFWVPTTEEELEDLGEKGDRENVAKRYMDMVRKRKGLATSRRIVESAEKQRTLKSN